jgi:hypothetical protein
VRAISGTERKREESAVEEQVKVEVMGEVTDTLMRVWKMSI